MEACASSVRRSGELSRPSVRRDGGGAEAAVAACVRALFLAMGTGEKHPDYVCMYVSAS